MIPRIRSGCVLQGNNMDFSVSVKYSGRFDLVYLLGQPDDPVLVHESRVKRLIARRAHEKNHARRQKLDLPLDKAHS